MGNAGAGRGGRGGAEARTERVGRGGKFGVAGVWGAPLNAGSVKLLPHWSLVPVFLADIRLAVGLSYLAIGLFPADPTVLSIRL